uniref:CUB domain-containing protein n=1 Tax=Meloidogyne enterolobii TaxID=390850 RepID=A0A6V7Y493_MELEN|nr:unnamed protein product [Meloidogyne enterolobii]
MPSNKTLSSQKCSSLPTKEAPTVVRTSGPFATIYLRIDGQQQQFFNKKCGTSCTSIGFTIVYKTIELPTGCGGKIQAEESSSLLQSPNYPHIYFPNLDCLWIIQPKIISNNNTEDNDENNKLINNNEGNDGDPYLVDQKVEIFFKHFDVPTTVTQYSNPLLRHVTINSCVGDSLQIVEKELTYCNMQKPSLNLPIVAPYLSLKFHSDSSIGGSGFSIRYRSVCQKDFTLPNGTISPPNYPGPSSQPFKCTYRIIAKPSQAIRLRFDKIGFTTSFGSCFYNSRQNNPQIQDYVELSGGHSSNEVANKRYICPRYPFVAPGGEIVTSGIRPFSITYSTSGSPTNKGFLFYYETFNVGCGGVFTINENGEQKITITSPNYPEPYIPFMYCVYFLRVPIGKAVRLSFDVFDIENVAHRDDCDFDNVRVFDTYTDDNEYGQLLGKFCGKSLPPPLISNSGQMAVVFISDRSVSGSGFSAKFQAIDLTSHCDRTFTESSGEFVFDFRNFEQNEYCNYKIQISSNRRILLNILNISSPCDYGTLMVRNGPSESSPGFAGLYGDSEICNENPIKQLISQGNRLFLRFRSITNKAIRFEVKYEQYEAGCGGHITGFSGAISTPQYPYKDSHSLRCEWLLAVPSGNKIQFQIIKLDNLDSEDSDGNCSPFSRNLLELYDIKYGGENSKNEHLIERYCKQETTNPLPIISSSNSLNVKFSQHGGSHHSPIFGFLAEFSTVCTDIVLEGLHGTLQSPGYPQRVLLPRNCKWKIQTPSGSRIQLQFHLFRITDTGNNLVKFMRTSPAFCAKNYLKVLLIIFNNYQIKNQIFSNEIKQIIWIKNGKTMKSNDSTKIPESLCLGIAEPMEIISKQNKLNLEFYSRNEPENHFWLSWNTIGCGGVITQNNSRLIANASEGADFVGEDPYRKCIWYIKPPIGYSIQVMIERMQTEPVPAGQKCFEVQPAGFTGGEKTRLRDGVQFYAVDSQFAFERLSGGNEEDLPLKAFCGKLKNVSFNWGGNSASAGGLAIVFSYHTDTTELLTDTLIGAAIFGDGTFAPVDDQIVFSAKINFWPISTEGNGGVIFGWNLR